MWYAIAGAAVGGVVAAAVGYVWLIEKMNTIQR